MGERLPVHFNPAHPGEAALEPGVDANGPLVLAMGLLRGRSWGVVLAITTIVVAVKEARRHGRA